MHRLASFVCVLLALAGAACSGAREPALRPSAAPADPRALVGCYHIGGRERLAFDSMPSAFGLLSPEPGGLQAWSYFDDRDSGYWRVLPGDTVEYVVGNSLHGSRFVGFVHGDSIVGRRRPWTDIVGVRTRWYRTVLHRESCSPDGAQGTPPPNATALMDSIPAVVAAVIRDSVLPVLPPDVPVEVNYHGNPHNFSARVMRLLGADPWEQDQSAVYASRVVAREFELWRDAATVLVVVTTCQDRPGDNLRLTRRQFRFAREESRWRLAGTSAVSDVRGVCGANLSQ